MNADGSDQHQITQPRRRELRARIFTPDGKRIIFSSNYKNPHSSQLRALPRQPRRHRTRAGDHRSGLRRLPACSAPTASSSSGCRTATARGRTRPISSSPTGRTELGGPMGALIPLILLGAVALFVLFVVQGAFKIIGQAEVMVVERLGRFNRIARSGLNILIPFIERPAHDRRPLLRERRERRQAHHVRLHRAHRPPRAGAQLPEPAGDHEGQRDHRHRRRALLPRRRSAEGHLRGAEPPLRARDAHPHDAPQHRRRDGARLHPRAAATRSTSGCARSSRRPRSAGASTSRASNCRRSSRRATSSSRWSCRCAPSASAAPRSPTPRRPSAPRSSRPRACSSRR